MKTTTFKKLGYDAVNNYHEGPAYEKTQGEKLICITGASEHGTTNDLPLEYGPYSIALYIESDFVGSVVVEVEKEHHQEYADALITNVLKGIEAAFFS